MVFGHVGFFRFPLGPPLVLQRSTKELLLETSAPGDAGGAHLESGTSLGVATHLIGRPRYKTLDNSKNNANIALLTF
jgi:hypothetical protein